MKGKEVGWISTLLPGRLVTDGFLQVVCTLYTHKCKIVNGIFFWIFKFLSHFLVRSISYMFRSFKQQTRFYRIWKLLTSSNQKMWNTKMNCSSFFCTVHSREILLRHIWRYKRGWVRAPAKPNFTLLFRLDSALLNSNLKEVAWVEIRCGPLSLCPGRVEAGTRKGIADLRLKRFSAFSPKIVTRRLEVGQKVLLLLLWPHLAGRRVASKTGEGG